MGSSSSLKRSSLVTTTTGNALAQFMIFSALTCVAYQFLVTQLIDSPSVQVDVPLTSSHSLKRNVPAPTPWIDSTELEKHRETRKETTSTTEFSCFVACVGLFGLMQRKKQRSEIEARIKAQRQIPTNDRTDLIPSSSSTTTVVDRFGDVPLDVKIQVLLYLEPRELVVCSMVNTAWHEAVGDSAEILWKLVFQRDFGETGERFTAIFPRFCWRQYYFFHHLSRPVEIARWMGQTQDRQCVVVQGRVYDVTTFLDRHPGGRHVLGDVIGTDATDVWEQFQHSNDAQEMMKEFLVEDVVLKQIEKKKLNGNLKIVYRRWRLVLWCIGYAHLFGHFSIRFMDVTLWLANWRTKAKAKVFSV